ncbi:MAG TPA: 3'(2'),5'-bisphosphate nucleotidase CysQ [Beijerinckiaceae bacterium]|jgi:3'(2'), 5'-bisphosphate nucleotidase
MRLDEEARDEIAAKLTDVAVEAGRLLRAMERPGADHRLKSDGSPTTDADLAAETLIIERLGVLWPEIPVVAEETSNAALPGDLFFLVDPLDGTRDYLHGTGEYTVNIALVAAGRPAASCVVAPALARAWAAGRTTRESTISESGAFDWREVRVRQTPPDGLVALVSRRHGDAATEACLSTLSIGTRRTASSALKFCLIASGEADIYVRCGPTMEWDTAAGDHILTRAGGTVVKGGGGVMTYGHHGRGYVNGPFAALGDPSLSAQLNLPMPAAA